MHNREAIKLLRHMLIQAHQLTTVVRTEMNATARHDALTAQPADDGWNNETSRTADALKFLVTGGRHDEAALPYARAAAFEIRAEIKREVDKRLQDYGLIGAATLAVEDVIPRTRRYEVGHGG